MINLNLGPHQRIVITIDPSPWAARKGATVFTLTLMGRLRATFFDLLGSMKPFQSIFMLYFCEEEKMQKVFLMHVECAQCTKCKPSLPPAPFQPLKFFPI